MAEKKKFDYVGNRKIFFGVSIGIIVITIICALIFGINVAIEFKGGTLLTYSYEGTVSTEGIKSTVESLNFGNVNVTSGSAFGSDMETINVSFASSEGLTAENQLIVTETLQSAYQENNITAQNTQDVTPSIGSTFFLKCLVAVLFSFVLLVIYIAFRFKKISGWSSGVFAIVALLHDVMIVFAVFVFGRLSIDANFMAVVLTILGCSINNTIVIYDRIRENRTLYGRKLTLKELVNTSISQTLTRTLNTTITTAFAALAICVVAYICDVKSIISFALPMMIGLGAGLYSSVFIAGPLWVMWQEYKTKRNAVSKKSV